MPIWRSLLFDEWTGEPCAKIGRPTDISDCFGCLKGPDPVWLDPWGMYAQLQVDVASLAASLKAELWINLLEMIDDDAHLIKSIPFPQLQTRLALKSSPLLIHSYAC